jgi:hypothetical protein
MIGRGALVCLLASAAFVGGEVATAVTTAFAQVQTSEQNVVLAPGSQKIPPRVMFGASTPSAARTPRS